MATLGEDLLRYKTDQVYMVSDNETFSLNLALENPPWQCSWMLFTQKKVLEEHNHYLDWGGRFKMSAGAAIVTGFDERIIKDRGEDPVKIYKKFRDYRDNSCYIKLEHNGLNFDVFVERQWALYTGHEHDWNYLENYYDTNAIERAIQKGFKPGTNRLAWQFALAGYREKGLKSSLGFLAKKYEIDFDEKGLHRGENDIVLNAEIWKKQLFAIEI